VDFASWGFFLSSASVVARGSHLSLRCSRTSGQNPTLRFIGGGFERRVRGSGRSAS
jgi:hypothetical protein